MKKLIVLFGLILLTSQITACIPVIIGGAVAGGAMAADRRTSGIYIEDENIEQKSLININKIYDKKAHINVTSYNRNVLITGEVPTHADIAKIESIVRAITNVRGITNALAAQPNSTLSSRSSDTYITSKIKTQFIGDKRFAANHVKVVTERGTAYLLGIVKKDEADAAAEDASAISGVIEVVKVFEFMN